MFLLRSKTRHDRFGHTSSCIRFFFFLLLFLSLSSFLATYSSISRPSPLLLLSLKTLPSPSFLVLVEPPLQFSIISSRLQDSIDEDTVHNLSLSLVSTPKKIEKKKKGEEIQKKTSNFFSLSRSVPLRILLQFFAVTSVQQSTAWNARSLDLRRYVALRSSRPLGRGWLFAGRENRGRKKKPWVVKKVKTH